MADVHDKKTRSYNMSRIRAKEDRVSERKRDEKES